MHVDISISLSLSLSLSHSLSLSLSLSHSHSLTHSHTHTDPQDPMMLRTYDARTPEARRLANKQTQAQANAGRSGLPTVVGVTVWIHLTLLDCICQLPGIASFCILAFHIHCSHHSRRYNENLWLFHSPTCRRCCTNHHLHNYELSDLVH